VCLISRGPGHIDFGGMGYLRTMKALQSRGHDVIAYTSKKLTNLLLSHQIKAVEVKNIDWLWLHSEAYEYDKIGDEFFIGLKFIELQIKKEKPDVILVDSLLGLAADMARSLKVPFVSFGSPGGNWKKVEKAIVPGYSIHNTNGFKDRLYSVAKWLPGNISAFCNSPYLNVVFMGKEFYGEVGENTAYLNLFTNVQPIKEKRIGVSLGSGTVNFEKMKRVLVHADQEFSKDIAIEIYGYSKDVEELSKLLPDNILKRVKIENYVDFSKVLPGLTHLIYAGGIGSSWYCVEYNIIPVVVSGNIHDQDFNASRLKALDWGLVWIEETALLRVENKKNPKQSFEFNYNFDSLIAEIEQF